MENKSFDTLAVHAGEDRSENYGAVSAPIFPSTVFAFSNADEASAIHNEQKHGYYYGRLGNPTTEALERTIAELERGESALAFASGMAAISGAVLANVSAGDHIVAPASMYSTTNKFFQHIEKAFKVETSFVDAADAASYAKALRPETKIVWIETPSNPLLTITDIREVTRIAREAAALSVVDNTFATPFNQRPLELGADLVVHSATKYLGGHSDLTAGIIAGRKDLIARVRDTAFRLYGGNIAPHISWLIMRGIKTLGLRMERHNSNAFALANMLGDDPRVKAVHYPALPGHRNHDIAAEQMSGFGGMISFDLGTIEAGKAFVNGVRLCTLATSLGGVETIVQHSASMTHATLSPEQRLEAGVTEGLIRLSVGIEGLDDLTADISSALDAIQ